MATEQKQDGKKRVWSWEESIMESDLSPTTRLVLLVLATHMNNFGQGCYPSLDRIAKYSGLTERAVRVQINKAIESGWLVKSKRRLKGSEWNSNIYHPAFPNEAALKQVAGDEGNTVPLSTSNGISVDHHNPNEGNTIPLANGDEGNVIPPRGELGSGGEGNDVPTNLPVLTNQYSDNPNGLSAGKPACEKEHPPNQSSGSEGVQTPIDLKKQLWAVGKRYLIANGCSEKHAGSLLGKWRKTVGDAAMLNILAAAEAEAASEPISFIEACISNHLSKGQIHARNYSKNPTNNSHSAAHNSFLAAAHSLLDESAARYAGEDRSARGTASNSSADKTNPR